jgi:hypothetical protein
MRRASWTPSIVPDAYDQAVYIVLDDFGRNGRAYRETDVEQADLETTITNLLRGEYSNPVRIIAFNTAGNWSQDVSEDIACELRRRCQLLGGALPSSVEEFVDQHDRQSRLQLPLPLRLL